MATITATRREPEPPCPDRPQVALASWPLGAVLDLDAVLTAPGSARAWTRQTLRKWRLPGLAGTAELLVSELVTNAVLASRSVTRPAIQLVLVCDRQQFVIFVRDFDPGTPKPRHASADDENGRGLLLVDSMSDRFGWYQPDDGTPGKVVWAILPART